MFSFFSFCYNSRFIVFCFRFSESCVGGFVSLYNYDEDGFLTLLVSACRV